MRNLHSGSKTGKQTIDSHRPLPVFFQGDFGKTDPGAVKGSQKESIMLYGKYEFVCRFEDEAHLPPFKGSTVRGLLGHALKRTVCVLKRQECAECLLRHDCLYARMFGLPPPTEKAAVNASAEPHPFVLEPPLEEKTVYRPGETITIGLILFGEINRKLPYFIYAFDEMGRIGMGKRVDGKAPQFKLEQVYWNHQTVYQNGAGSIQILNELPDLELTEGNSDDEIDLLTVALASPLRFKTDGKIGGQLPFDQLVRLSLRRAAALLTAFGPGEPRLDYPGLVAKASSVQTVSEELAWADWEHYSNRQRQRIPTGGLIGRAVYAGELGRFMPLIDFAAKVHLGKNTTHGLGQIAIQP
jgi:hypothetical protein